MEADDDGMVVEFGCGGGGVCVDQKRKVVRDVLILECCWSLCDANLKEREDQKTWSWSGGVVGAVART